MEWEIKNSRLLLKRGIEEYYPTAEEIFALIKGKSLPEFPNVNLPRENFPELHFSTIGVNLKIRISFDHSKIRSRDTSIEIVLRKELWRRGYRYRKNYKKLPGRPDIALRKYKIAVFCDSEFFHGKDWRRLKAQLKREKKADFWIEKISRNRKRDEETDKKLRHLGWTVLRFWEREIMRDTAGGVKAIEEAVFESE